MQKLIVTDAGLAALINAQHSGTTPIVITQLKLGDTKWIADASATELKNVTKTFDVQYGGTLDPHTIQVAAIDQSEEQYQAYELGIFTDSGILFAVISSDSTPVIEKHGSSIIEILCHVVVKSAEDGDIQVGDGSLSFITPSASETTAGIAQFATEEEVLAGEEDAKMLSPATLHKKTATEERIGLVELATTAEVKSGTDATRAITPKSLKDAGIIAVPTATDAVQGKVELATTAEVKSGTDATRAVTPKALVEAIKALGYRKTPPGTLIHVLTKATTPPEGFLFCDGSKVPKADYPTLAALGVFADDGTHITLPNLDGRVLQATSTAENVGQLVEASLPNIRGETHPLKEGDATSLSDETLLSYVSSPSPWSFFPTWEQGKDKLDIGVISLRKMVFDSSRSNSIYAGSKVQPYAIRTRVLISY